MRGLTTATLAAAALALTVTAASGGGRLQVVDPDAAPSAALSGGFAWTVTASGLVPGKAYQTYWHFVGDDGCEYWMGESAHVVRANGMLTWSESFDDLTGSLAGYCPDDPRGEYYVILSLAGQSWSTPALDPDGRPLEFEQDV